MTSGRTAQPYIATLNAAKENSQGVKLSQKQQTTKTRVYFSQKTKRKKLSGLTPTSSEEKPTPPL